MTHRRNRLAKQLCVLYHEATRNALNGVTGGRADRDLPSLKLDEVDDAARKAFVAAATMCERAGADPREWVAAQFAMWKAASAYHRKFLLPSLQSMATLAAHVRYLEHKARDAVGRSRRPTADADDPRKHYAEERKLRGLARLGRRQPIDILTEQPELFTRDFLKHKGVWGVVRELWDERRGP